MNTGVQSGQYSRDGIWHEGASQLCEAGPAETPGSDSHTECTEHKKNAGWHRHDAHAYLRLRPRQRKRSSRITEGKVNPAQLLCGAGFISACSSLTRLSNQMRFFSLSSCLGYFSFWTWNWVFEKVKALKRPTLKSFWVFIFRLTLKWSRLTHITKMNKRHWDINIPFMLPQRAEQS